MGRQQLLNSERASEIKQRLNDGAIVSDLAAELGLPYSAVYNIFRESCWKDVEPRIIGAERALKPFDKHELRPMLSAWGYSPVRKIKRT